MGSIRFVIGLVDSEDWNSLPAKTGLQDVENVARFYHRETMQVDDCDDDVRDTI